MKKKIHDSKTSYIEEEIEALNSILSKIEKNKYSNGRFILLEFVDSLTHPPKT